jgi:asparagine synthetase B (glutamine-hydrolysing)
MRSRCSQIDIPRLSLELPPEDLPFEPTPSTPEHYINGFINRLAESVRIRVENIPSPANEGYGLVSSEITGSYLRYVFKNRDSRLAILFSGGIDCTFISYLAHT